MISDQHQKTGKIAGRIVPVQLQDPSKLFQTGVALLKQGRPWEARQALRRAVELDPKESRYLSYFGLSLGLAEKKTDEAIELCERAVERDFGHADLYLNLGRAYLMGRNRNSAYRAFQAGLRLDDGNRELQVALAGMGERQQPVFSFLSRQHPINRQTGKWLSKLGLR